MTKPTGRLPPPSPIARPTDSPPTCPPKASAPPTTYTRRPSCEQNRGYRTAPQGNRSAPKSRGQGQELTTSDVYAPRYTTQKQNSWARNCNMSEQTAAEVKKPVPPPKPMRPYQPPAAAPAPNAGNREDEVITYDPTP